MPRRKWIARLAIVSLLATACRAPASESTTPVALSDANIAAIVVAANNADILYADLALAKSQDRDVREFATMVKKDHESMNEATLALARRLGVTPEDNEGSFDIRDDADTKRLMLRDLEFFAFDSAYATNESTYHMSVLVMIDRTLVPNAQNTELRALLVSVRPAIAAHLEHALRLERQKTVR